MQLTSLAFLLRRHVHICFGLWHGIFAANLSVMVFMLWDYRKSAAWRDLGVMLTLSITRLICNIIFFAYS